MGSGQAHFLIRYNPAPAWIYALDSLGFLDVNDAAVRAYGWSRDQFLGMSLAQIRPIEDLPALLANVNQMRSQAEGRTGPWRHLRHDGSLTEVVVSFVSLRFGGRAARLAVAEEVGAQRVATVLDRLSPREHEVFHLVARGWTSQKIAAKLGLSPKSVETYRARLRQKLGLSDQADLIRFALEHGVLGRA